MTGPTCRRFVLVLAMVLAVSWSLTSLILPTTPAAARGSGPTTTTTAAPAPGGDIIPAPNSGAEAQSSGDRGGAAQVMLFGVVVGGLALMVFLVWRSSIRARRR